MTIPEGEDIVQFGVPFLGTWYGMPAHLVPEGALYNSSNVYIHNGQLKHRPGLGSNIGSLSSFAVGGGVYSSGTEKGLVVISGGRLFYNTDQATWEDIGAAPTGGMVPYVLFNSGGVVYGIYGRAGSLRSFDGSSVSNINATTGSIPSIHDLEVVFDRVVAIEQPYTIKWTGALDFTNWSDLNVALKPEGGDRVVSVKKLTNLGFVLYKENSIYLAFAQAGPDSAAFAFRDFHGEYEGPAGIYSIIDVEGSHLIFSRSGRLALFNGSSHQWIADGLWGFIRDDIDGDLAYRTFGLYDKELNIALFVYPRSGSMVGLVIVNLPEPSKGIDRHAAFLGTLEAEVDFGYNYTIGNTDTVMFSGVGSYLLEGNIDINSYYSCMLQTPLRTFKNFGHNVINTETLCERQDGYGTVEVSMLSSRSLESPGGRLLANSKRIDLNLLRLKEEHIAFTGQPGRYVGLRYNWLSNNTFIYNGSIIYGRPLE